MATIDITRDAGGAVSFSPDPLSVPTGTPVIWRNLDSQSQHQITGQVPPSATPFTLELLAPFQQGSDPDTTSELLIDNDSVDYHCALHRAEQGRITIDRSTT